MRNGDPMKSYSRNLLTVAANARRLFGWRHGVVARRRVIHQIVSLSLVLVAASVAFGEDDSENNEPSTSSSSGQIVLVIGAEGTSEYGEQFTAWADQWRQLADRSGTPLLAIGDSEVNDKSDREQLQAAIESFAGQPMSPLWIVFLGHGTFTRGVAKFNLRGPDVSAEELAQWLQPHTRPVVVVNCASASGPFVNRLSGNNRIVVTATKSGTEQNFARFGKYFTQAIAAPDSDLDHDDEVSVHEAFLRAAADVRDFYEAESRIATEHPLIDDNGDGRGTPSTMFRGTRPNASAKDGAELDGKLASRVTLAPADTRLPFTDGELSKRAELESSLDQLRSKKTQLDPQEYDRQLETLLLRLAKLYQAAEERLVAKPARSASE